MFVCSVSPNSGLVSAQAAILSSVSRIQQYVAGEQASVKGSNLIIFFAVSYVWLVIFVKLVQSYLFCMFDSKLFTLLLRSFWELPIQNSFLL